MKPKRRPGLGREEWIAAAREVLAESGIDGVRVEVLAARLGVTKGGFYWHFEDRGDLLAALAADWRDGRIAAMRTHAAQGGSAPRAALALLLSLYTRSANPRGMAIELALRDWARRDGVAAAAARAVDAERLGVVGGLFRKMGLRPAEARARALLFYAFLFGDSLMAVDRKGPAARRLARDCRALLLPAEGG